MRRNRLCVAIKAGRQSELPKGSMSLATSSTGAHYSHFTCEHLCYMQGPSFLCCLVALCNSVTLSSMGLMGIKISSRCLQSGNSPACCFIGKASLLARGCRPAPVRGIEARKKQSGGSRLLINQGVVLLLPAGSTMYMDPEPTVALNNREAMLSGQEEEEEARILAALSSAVAARSARIWQVRPLLAWVHLGFLDAQLSCIEVIVELTQGTVW